MRFRPPIQEVVVVVALIAAWLLGAIALYVVIGLGAVYGLFAACGKAAWCRRALGSDAVGPVEHPESKWAAALWVLAGIAVIGAAAAYLERVEPYYFTQDDNFCGLLPELLQGCRSLFSGIFPEWEPYQLLGAPTASLGLCGYTYPPTFVSYFIARHLLGNEYATIEVMSVMHLVGGFLAAYWAARMWRISAPLAMAVGLSYVLSGYMLITGRSWANALTAIAWIPVPLGFAGQMKRGPVTWKWAAALGIVLGLYFHTGFSQLWVYSLVFLALLLGLLVVTGAVPFRRSLWAVPGVLLGIALAAPLLYVQMEFGASVSRPDLGLGLVPRDFAAMLLPYPLVTALHPQHYGTTDLDRMGLFYYSGTVFCAVGALALGAMAAARWSRRTVSEGVFLLLALLALVLACGDKAYLWPALHRLPWFDKFRNAERFMPFFNIFVALGAALVLQRLFSAWRRGRVWGASAALVVAALMAFCASSAPPSHWTFADRPYPPLPDKLKPLLSSTDPLKPQRVGTLMPFLEVPLRYPPFKGYVGSLEQDFASVYSIPSMTGYGPLIWRHDFFQHYVLRDPAVYVDPLDREGIIAYEMKHRHEWFTTYGVRWATLPSQFAYLFVKYFPELGVLHEKIPDFYTWTVDDVCPLAFAEANPKQAFPIGLSCRGVTVDVSEFPQGGPFIVNFLAWPDFRVYADGRPVAFEPDTWGRIRADVPPGATTLEARYSPPWGRGLLIGVVLIAAASGLTVLLTRFGKEGLKAAA